MKKQNILKELAIFCMATCMVSACNKVENETLMDGKSKGEVKTEEAKIPVYATYEEVKAIIKECIDGEKSGGNSIGAKSDSFFEGINPTSFSTEEELLAFYKENANYLDTVVDENNEIAVYPKWNDNMFRYVANEDGMFIIGDYVSRIYKHGTYTTTLDMIDILAKATEEEAIQLDIAQRRSKGYPSNVANHPGCVTPLEWYTNTLQASHTSGNDRVTLKLISQFSAAGGGTSVNTHAQVTSEHKAIWWWPENHTLTCSGSVSGHKRLGSDTWEIRTGSANKTEGAYVMNVLIDDTYLVDDFVNIDVYHYWSYSITAYAGGVGPATISHSH